MQQGHWANNEWILREQEQLARFNWEVSEVDDEPVVVADAVRGDTDPLVRAEHEDNGAERDAVYQAAAAADAGKLRFGPDGRFGRVTAN